MKKRPYKMGVMMKLDTIYCGDTLKVMSDWPDGCVDLVFTDPPYNIGYVYDNYRDDLPDDRYVVWCEAWMRECSRLLKPDGSFYIAIGDDFAAQLRLVGKKLGLTLRNWIIWSYAFGQNARTKFSRSHTHILYFAKNEKKFTFNDELLRYPSARHTEYQDLRADPKGRIPNDVWDEFPRVCGTFKEREGHHGCQLPEALLQRVILASSNRGEVVLDPLIGTGTTAVAAKRLGRRYLGIDISPEYVKRACERLEKVSDESGAKPSNGAWPSLHDDFLLQLYRETKVALRNLLPNEAAMRVIAASLSMRCGHEYTVEVVRARFEQIAQERVLPKLPNDVPFAARNHVTSEGKKYKRKTMRVTAKRHAGKADDLALFALP